LFFKTLFASDITFSGSFTKHMVIAIKQKSNFLSLYVVSLSDGYRYSYS